MCGVSHAAGVCVFYWSGSEGRLTVSVGIADCPRDSRNYEAVFDVSDRRLYEAKAAGRNRVVGGEKGMRLVHAG